MHFLSDPENFGYEPDLTMDDFQPRVERIAAKTAAGENAFMVIILRETGDIIGFGGFNSLPRTAMLNSSERKSDNIFDESKVLAGDMGISIDHHHHRKVCIIRQHPTFIILGPIIESRITDGTIKH